LISAEATVLAEMYHRILSVSVPVRNKGEFVRVREEKIEKIYEKGIEE